MPVPSPNDPTTLHVRRALDGDSESLTWIVSRFTPLLTAQAAHRMGPWVARQVDPEDVVAEAWLVALHKMPEFDPGDRRSTPVLLSYLAETVRFVANNALRAHLRGESRKAPRSPSGSDPVLKIEDEVSGIVSRAARLEASTRIREAIETLDDDLRTIVILRGIEGLSNQEIGEALDERANTVSHRYQRAVATLRRRLPRSVFEDLVDD